VNDRVRCRFDARWSFIPGDTHASYASGSPM
jgi:hypothetical protein